MGGRSAPHTCWRCPSTCPAGSLRAYLACPINTEVPRPEVQIVRALHQEISKQTYVDVEGVQHATGNAELPAVHRAVVVRSDVSHHLDRVRDLLSAPHVGEKPSIRGSWKSQRHHARHPLLRGTAKLLRGSPALVLKEKRLHRGGVTRCGRSRAPRLTREANRGHIAGRRRDHSPPRQVM